MKNLILLIVATLFSASLYAGEVTGAGLTQILIQNNIDVNSFTQQGLDIRVKRPNLEKKLRIGKVKYYVGAREVYSAQKVNRVEFKPNKPNNFVWNNVESLEVDNRIIMPSDIKGFVIQK